MTKLKRGFALLTKTPTQTSIPKGVDTTAAVLHSGQLTIDLFAGIPVTDFKRALAWYEQLLGAGPTFAPHATEAVWDLAEHRSVFIEQRPEHAGHARHAIFVDDLDAVVEEIAARGIEPVERETYSNGVRKATYRDPDGNEIGFGGSPA